jgi:TRAP-type C4-dicarboxylate transport system permease small subunit
MSRQVPNDTSPPARVLERVHAVALAVAASVLILITAIILVGVVVRLVFDRPIPSSNELIGSCLMVALIYLSISSAHHIRITLFVGRFPPNVQRGVESAVVVVCVLGLVAAAYAALGAALESFLTNESTVGLFTFDLFPYRLLIFVGVVLLAIRIGTGGRRWLQMDRTEDVSTPEAEDEVAPARTPSKTLAGRG